MLQIHVSSIRLNATSYSLLVSLLLVLFYNNAFWNRVLNYVDAGEASQLIFLGALFMLLWAWISLPLQLVAFRWTLKPVAILLVTVASAVSYFSGEYGIIVDRSMIVNVLQTDTAEAAELVTGKLLFHFLLYAIVPGVLLALVPVNYGSGYRGLLKRVGVVGLTLAVAAALFLTSNKDFTFLFRQHSELKSTPNPNYPVYAMVKVLRSTAKTVVVQPLGRDAVREHKVAANGRRSVLLLVVGETARAANFSLNGYYRPTNPELDKLDIINFPDTVSCGTSTAQSLPCMFSHLARKDFSVSRAERYENLLDILAHAGLNVVWLDNNAGCKGLCERVRYIKMKDLEGSTKCTKARCLDEVLLDGVRTVIEDTEGDVVIVVHPNGSHGPAYYERIPEAFRHYLPECRSVNLQECSREEIVNSYDNTILYTDHVLARLIENLQSQSGNFDTALWYVSDHGESLGENGLYLHGFPYALAPSEQTQVPFLLWLSEEFSDNHHIDRQCTSAQRSGSYSHDNLYHSLLGMFNIRTSVYESGLDVFAKCRKPPVATVSLSTGETSLARGH